MWRTHQIKSMAPLGWPFFCLLLTVSACELDFFDTAELVFEGRRVELVADGRSKREPAWSPDGSMIAYSVYQPLVGISAYDLSTSDTSESVIYEAPGNRIGNLNSSDVSASGQTIVYFDVQQMPDNRVNYSLNLLDLDTGAIRTFDTGMKQAYGPRISPDEMKVAFWGVSWTDEVGFWVISLADGSTKFALSWYDIVGISWSPDGSKLIFPDRVGFGRRLSQIHVIDIETAFMRTLFPDSLASQAQADWSVKNEIAMVVIRSGSTHVEILDFDTNTVTPIEQQFLSIDGIRWSHSGEKLAVVGRLDPEMRGTYVYSSGGELLLASSFYQQPYWLGENELMVRATHARTYIEVFSLKDSSIMRVTEPELDGLDFQPAWFPDSRHLAYVTSTDESGGLLRIHSLDISTKAISRFLSDGFSEGNQRNPAISPDGRYLLFDNGNALFLATTNGSEIVDLGRQNGLFLLEPAWNITSNGAACRRSDGQLVITTTDTSFRLEQTVISGDFRDPAWLHKEENGHQYIAASGGQGIYLLSPEGQPARLFVADGHSPAWSPDGTQLAYISFDRLYVSTVLLTPPN